MATTKPRTVEYYQYLFLGAGSEFGMKKLLEAAKETDNLYGIPERTPEAYQIWSSNMLRRLQMEPALATITKDQRGFYEKIEIHNAEECAKLLGRGSKVTSVKVAEESKSTPTAIKKKELSQQDEFFITFKAARTAVRTGRGKDTSVSIKKCDLIRACKYDEIKYSMKQIAEAISKTSSTFGLKLDVEYGEEAIKFFGHNKALERVCAIGREVYPGMRCFLFEEAAGEDALKNIKDSKIEAAAAERKQQLLEKPLTTVLTDDERFRIFLCGGYIMEHDRAPMTELQEYLETKGMSISILKLESALRATPEFIIEGNLVYLDSRPKDFWDKFRKQYRPIDTNDYEQVIFEMPVSLEYVKKELNGCLCAKASPDRPVYRVNIPRRSAIANKNFRKFLTKFREGDCIYTDTAFVRQVRKKAEKDDAQDILEDDVCRYEIGYFINKNKKKGD